MNRGKSKKQARGRPVLLTGKQVERARYQYTIQKMSFTAIAAQFGLSESAVQRTLSRNGVRSRSRLFLNPKQQEIVCALYQSGWRCTEIAARFGCSGETVRAMLARNKVDRCPMRKIDASMGKRIIEQHLAGMSWRQNAALHSVSRENVRKYLLMR